MKFLIIEDQEFKRKDLITFLEKHNIESIVFEYTLDALRYITRNENDISGIILDFGLQSSKDIFDYSIERGLDVLFELDRRGIYIPVLINSTTFLGMMDEFPFVYGQRTMMNNYNILEEFVTFLKEEN